MTFGMSRQGVGVEAETWPAPPQADVQQAARILSADEAEALFMSKYAVGFVYAVWAPACVFYRALRGRQQVRHVCTNSQAWQAQREQVSLGCIVRSTADRFFQY